MTDNNIYKDIYKSKSSDVLKSIIEDSQSTDEMKILAINILMERNEADDDLIDARNSIIEKENDKRTAYYIDANDRYNTFKARSLAVFIDGLIISVFTNLINPLFQSFPDMLFNLASLLVIVLPYIYSIILHGEFGQTFGKMITNVKLFSKNEKDKITYKQAFLRDIVPLSCVTIFQIITIIGFNKESDIIKNISFYINATPII